MHKAKTKSHRSGWLFFFCFFYLIQFHSLSLEAAHVDGKVVVLLFQQLHPKKHKIQPISMFVSEAFSRIPRGFVPSRCMKLVLWPRRLLTDLSMRSPVNIFKSKLKVERNYFCVPEWLAARQTQTNATFLC